MTALLVTCPCGDVAPNYSRGLCQKCYQRQPRRLAYNRWRSMVQRCTNPNHPRYAGWGGRGITVCPEWLDFEAFYADVGDAPPGMSLDRVDNDGNYEPGNVRWATPREQLLNRRNAQGLRTHCPHGHPYDDANTYISRWGRKCRECTRVGVAALRELGPEGRPVIHGLASTYNNYRCRCEPCREAKSAQGRTGYASRATS